MASTPAGSGPRGGRQRRRASRPSQPPQRRCPPSWASLIRKVYHADPLVCRQCGGKLKVVAYVTGEITVRRIVAGLGLSPPEEEKPPPIREMVRVPVHDEGREIQAT